MSEDILQRQKKLQDYLNRTPFADFIGFKCEIMGDEMTAILPFEEKIIGNPSIRALHGGATGAFLELTAMAQLFLLSDEVSLAKPINLTIDYLRQAKAENLYDQAGAAHRECSC